ncbi:hypothetical protein [Flavobacterium sp. WC2430]|uniref:hypothetical protein n=1 Tax=Flavobacterium sp. WC2430 TaxID=3234137 RepID=UPI003465E232
MAKVFRFHDDNNSIEHWMDSQPYGKTAIDGIKDPDGAKASKEITSIPSPFARIDLVKTAFEYLVNGNNLDGNTIYHKMVSDSLDVAEIFFNIDKFKDKISIIVWDKNKDLNNLLESKNPKHKILGETLQLFLTQDANAYNFDHTQRLYLLNYFGGPNPVNIIGGTSPATLFFTSANKLDYVNIEFGNDKVFDGLYQPFYKRDFEFQKFIYGLRKFNPEFVSYFKAFNDYLDLNFPKLSNDQKSIINNLSQLDFENQFTQLSAGTDGNLVEILGINLRKKGEANPGKKSGFIINSSKFQGIKPMVLPVDDFSEKIVYTSDYWSREKKAPFVDDKPINQRILPFDGAIYPYLTISDFLEPYIIKTIYPIHAEKFFDGNLNIQGDINKGYLLPIKKAYFDYFELNDLEGIMPDGKKVIEINQMPIGGVNVTLRIPIQDNKYISYTRTYRPSVNEYQILDPKIEENKGAIIENQFGLTLFPFLKLEEDDKNNYRIALTDYDVKSHTKHNQYQLNFFKNNENKQVKEKAKKRRSSKDIQNITSDYYVLEEGFDYIELKNSWATGLIIPKFRTLSPGTAKFTFAVDFGTTNTHVEYRKDGGEPQPLEINETDIQIATLHDPNNEHTIKNLQSLSAFAITEIMIKEFLPFTINRNSEYSFPQRTVIVSNKNLDLDKPTYSLGDFNIPFFYEKNNIAVGSKAITNLKWSDYTQNPNDIKIIDAYFENLLFLIKNKVLLNGGDLNQTKLIWMYPSSMTDYRINMLDSKWNELFKKNINSIHLPLKMSESIAPFYYFNTQEGIQALENPVVSIDIGGGTTDIVIYINNKPCVLSSFKFAANAVFGDFIGRSSKINGFILKYLNRIQKLLEDNKQFDLLKVLEEIKESGKSEDVIAFFFSIEKNRTIREKNIPISFSKKLSSNADFKIIFLLFYAALIYHIAKLMKAEGLKRPRYITFSGTGSKTINLLDGNTKLCTLNEFTKLIFNKVFELDSDYQSELKQVENPKEISCKGALMSDFESPLDINKIKSVLIGDTGNNLIREKSILYSQIDSDLEKEVINEYNHFIELFFNLNKEFKFKDKFGINPSNLNDYLFMVKENSLDNLKLSINEKKKEIKNDLNIELEETLFFYPLIGALNNLAHKIQTELTNQES